MSRGGGAYLFSAAGALGPVRRELLRLVRLGGPVLRSFPDRDDEGYRGDDAAATLGGQFERTLGTEGFALELSLIHISEPTRPY